LVEAWEGALAVAVVAVVTYATRAAGLLLEGAWAERPAVREALTILPACALVGIVVPGLRDGDAGVWLATAVVTAVYVASRHLPSAIVAGLALLFALSWLG